MEENIQNSNNLPPQSLTCPKCATTTPIDSFFCPGCGYKYKDPPPSTGVGRQIWLYFISFFLPPLGIFPGIKYMRAQESKARLIGAVCIILTIVSFAITVFASIGFINTYRQILSTGVGAGSLGL